MAEELRWVNLIDASTGTSSETNNAVASFQNTTDENIYIRNIDVTGVLVDQSPATNAIGYCYTTDQISKQVAYISTSGDTNWKQNLVCNIAVSTDGTNTNLGNISDVQQKALRFAKGQLVLEPNETLYIHNVLTMSGLEATHHTISWVIGYHF